MKKLIAALMALMIDQRIIVAYTLNNPKVIRIEPPLIMPNRTPHLFVLLQNMPESFLFKAWSIEWSICDFP